LHIVPSVFRYLAEVVAEEGLRVPLRSVIFCGEAISYDAIRSWQAAHPPELRPAWCNVYGITETTVYNTFAALGAADIERSGTAAPIGRGYRHSPVVVLDEARRSTAPHEVGEIFIGGRQVAAGYLGNPELTAQRFHHLPGRPGRWYQTGDLGSVDEDGTLRCLGRRDEQVKIRGHRIELGEIDHALRAIPWLRDGAVVASSAGRGELLLTAFVVPSSTMDVSGTALLDRLRAELAARLPGYLLPARVERVDRLPRNANGKTDRRALAAPDAA
jgi:acyl-coenzyme A synthetase/AMP-(fatty) acid ligase